MPHKFTTPTIVARPGGRNVKTPFWCLCNNTKIINRPKKKPLVVERARVKSENQKNKPIGRFSFGRALQLAWLGQPYCAARVGNYGRVVHLWGGKLLSMMCGVGYRWLLAVLEMICRLVWWWIFQYNVKKSII